MTALLTDLNYAFRLLRKSPGFSVLAIISLALGIAANVVIFSIVNGVLLKPLDFPHPENLYTVEEVIPKLAKLAPTLPVNPRHAAEWKKAVPSIQQMGLMQSGNLTLGGARAIRVPGASVTPDFLQAFEAKPLMGRLIDKGDAQKGHDRVAILSYGLWKDRFGGAPDILGKQIQIEGAPSTVIGVMPASFHCPQLGPAFSKEQAQVLIPLVLDLSQASLMGDFNYGAVVRLKPGANPQTVLANLDVAQAAIAKTFPEKLAIRAELTPLNSFLVENSRRALLVLLGAVLAVLLVVCLNLAALMLARANLRSQEMAIRSAVGASRWRLFRQALTAALLYAVLGGAAGTWLAAAGLKLVLNAAPASLPRVNDVHIDGQILLFAVGLTALTALVSGLYPAWQQSRHDPQEALGASSRSSTSSRKSARGRTLLIAFEVSLSTMLLVVAGLLMSSFGHLLHLNTGFRVEHGVSAQLDLPAATYHDPQAADNFYNKLLTMLKNRPGIKDAGLISQMPLDGEMWHDDLSRPGDTRPVFSRPFTNVRFVSGSYFPAMGVPVLQGRAFANRNGEKKGVAMISATVAHYLWPNENPIGRTLLLDDNSLQVIGVAGNTRADIDKAPPLMVYVPYWATDVGPVRDFNVVLRSSLDSRDTISTLRRAVTSIDHGVPISKVRTFDQIVSESVAPKRFQTILAGIFGIAALLVAALGIFGVVAGIVTGRRNEIGIRMALGATSAGVLKMILRQGLTPVIIGLIAGLVAAVPCGSVLRALLFQVSPTDPVTLCSVAALIIAAAALACWIPARRAARIDPMEALHYQ